MRGLQTLNRAPIPVRTAHFKGRTIHKSFCVPNCPFHCIDGDNFHIHAFHVFIWMTTRFQAKQFISAMYWVGSHNLQMEGSKSLFLLLPSYSLPPPHCSLLTCVAISPGGSSIPEINFPRAGKKCWKEGNVGKICNEREIQLPIFIFNHDIDNCFKDLRVRSKNRLTIRRCFSCRGTSGDICLCKLKPSAFVSSTVTTLPWGTRAEAANDS